MRIKETVDQTYKEIHDIKDIVKSPIDPDMLPDDSDIWAEFDPLPLVTLIKYIDFRVFRVSGVSWGNLNRIHIWGTKWEFHRGTHVNL